jgi:hypothetical protein
MTDFAYDSALKDTPYAEVLFVKRLTLSYTKRKTSAPHVLLSTSHQDVLLATVKYQSERVKIIPVPKFQLQNFTQAYVTVMT